MMHTRNLGLLDGASAVDNCRNQEARSEVDAAEALRHGWLELWYQPKIHTRSLLMHGVEAVLRLRHPDKGVLSPTPTESNDARISNFIVSRLVADSERLRAKGAPVEIAVNLPVAVIQTTEAISRLCAKLPSDFGGLIIEIDTTELVQNLTSAIAAARALRDSRVAISVCNLGQNWLALSGLRPCPFVEMKVAQPLIKNPEKSTKYRHIVQLANEYGARTIAGSVETWADFLAIRDLGFDLVQGPLFADPMTAEDLAKTCWSDQGNAFSSECIGQRIDAPGMIGQAIY